MTQAKIKGLRKAALLIKLILGYFILNKGYLKLVEKCKSIFKKKTSYRKYTIEGFFFSRELNWVQFKN